MKSKEGINKRHKLRDVLRLPESRISARLKESKRVSDSQIEPTSSKPLHRGCLLFDATLRIKSLLSLSLNLLSALLLIVLAFHILQLTSESFNLILVLIDLGLVHVKFSCHRLHLTSFLLKVLLIDRELLSNLWTRLSCQQILQLNIELFLFLDDYILLDDLLCLLDQALLQSLDLLKHLPGVRVSTLKLSPSVVVQGVFKLLTQGLNLESLS